MNISDLMHPYYKQMVDLWKAYRLTYEAGDSFIGEFLKKFSQRETDPDFATRKTITYVPAHAKGAVNMVKNGIASRIQDVKRLGGSPSYNKAVVGENDGVDLKNTSMNGFITRDVLPELLVQSRVGVYVDNMNLEGISIVDSKNRRPYVYYYQAEQILNWTYDPAVPSRLTKLLLRDVIYEEDEVFGLPTDITYRYRFYNLTKDGVQVKIFEEEDSEPTQQVLLKLEAIPFVMLELTNSLLCDIYKYQVALLNMASSDVAFCTKANFPFYVEQFDPKTRNHLQGPAKGDETGTKEEATEAEKQNVSVGVSSGRRYPIGANQPAFIHPSPDPVRVSMEKQKQLIEEIRQITDLSLSNIQMKSASAESKKEDKTGLESGLTAIGLELERGEKEILKIWNMYEDARGEQSVKYPRTYQLLTNEQRLEQATSLGKLKTTVPSKIYQKEVAKNIAHIILAPTVDAKTLENVMGEIEKAELVISDPKDIIAAHEEGLGSDKLCAQALGFPANDIEQAKKDHAERLARIKEAQTSENDMGARGLKDESVDPDASVKEKEGKPQRGEGK